MERSIKFYQRGFLLIFAMVLITVMGFIGVILTRLFMNQTNTSTNLLLSKQTLYIALSGLEIAKRDVTQKSIACVNLAAQHTAEPLANGQFSVTGTASNALTLLSANISNSSSSIQITDATTFAPIGIVKIDNEYIYYQSISGNVLNNLSRGKGGSTASGHTAGAVVSQRQCYITSIGAIPSINAATHTNTVSTAVVMSAELSVGGFQPSVTSGGTVSMSGNAYIANPDITLNGEGYTGSTLGIVGSGSLNVSGSAGTMVENTTGTGLVSSTTKNGVLGDVVQNLPTDPSLYSSYFGSYTPEQLQAAAISQGHYFDTSLTSLNSIDGVTGSVIYINGDISVSGHPSITIGTPTAPVVLYVDGSVSSSGTLNLTVYGIIYVTGSINLTGNSSISGEGSLATEGALNMTGSTSISLGIESDDPVMSALYSTVVPGAGTTTYETENLGIQQIYP